MSHRDITTSSLPREISVPVEDLPRTVQSILHTEGYNRKSVTVRSATMTALPLREGYNDYTPNSTNYWSLGGIPLRADSERFAWVTSLRNMQAPLPPDVLVFEKSRIYSGGRMTTVGHLEVHPDVFREWAGTAAHRRQAALAARAAAGDAYAATALVAADAAMEAGADATAALLTASASALSELEQFVLACYARLTSAGRKDEFGRQRKYNWMQIESVTQKLIERGLLKRNKAGATGITPEGRSIAPKNVPSTYNW